MPRDVNGTAVNTGCILPARVESLWVGTVSEKNAAGLGRLEGRARVVRKELSHVAYPQFGNPAPCYTSAIFQFDAPCTIAARRW